MLVGGPTNQHLNTLLTLNPSWTVAQKKVNSASGQLTSPTPWLIAFIHVSPTGGGEMSSTGHMPQQKFSCWPPQLQAPT